MHGAQTGIDYLVSRFLSGHIIYLQNIFAAAMGQQFGIQGEGR